MGPSAGCLFLWPAAGTTEPAIFSFIFSSFFPVGFTWTYIADCEEEKIRKESWVTWHHHHHLLGREKNSSSAKKRWGHDASILCYLHPPSCFIMGGWRKHPLLSLFFLLIYCHSASHKDKISAEWHEERNVEREEMRRSLSFFFSSWARFIIRPW